MLNRVILSLYSCAKMAALLFFLFSFLLPHGYHTSLALGIRSIAQFAMIKALIKVQLG